MRVFAGPNGSGKTTMVNDVVIKGRMMYGCDLIDPNRHINPDEINSCKVLDFNKYGLKVDETDFQDFMLQSSFYENCNINIKDISINNNCFDIPKNNSYIGSMLSDYLRECYFKANERLFSFETVFSHSSKVDFLKRANEGGWQVYLYFVNTMDPLINCDRVNDRVLKGGHSVPEEKIIERYTRSLEYLYSALQYCRRAYIFDNTTQIELIAEIDPNGRLTFNGNVIPEWLNEYVLSKCQISVLS